MESGDKNSVVWDTERIVPAPPAPMFQIIEFWDYLVS